MNSNHLPFFHETNWALYFPKNLQNRGGDLSYGLHERGFPRNIEIYSMFIRPGQILTRIINLKGASVLQTEGI